MDVSIGSVSLGLQLDKSDLLSQMKDITQSAASMLQNGISSALRMGNSKVDLSGLIGGIGEVKNEVKALSTMIGTVIEKGMSSGAKDGTAAVERAVSGIKLPTIKVTATKGDLTNQLDNMVSLLDNTNAQIYTQQQLVDELKRRWNAMGNLGQQDSDVGLAMRKSILVAESALTSLEGKSDTMAMKTRAMESAIDGFGTSGTQSVQKVVAAATLADKKLSSVGNSGNLSGKKIASGINAADKSVKSLSSSAMSATGMDKRLASIESNVARVTRSVTALGRRFMVLFVGKIISAAFKDITASLTGASEKSDRLKNSLNALTTAGRTISNAVVTAIAPLVNIVGPALSNVSEMVRTFANRVAMFFAAVSGQSTVVQAKKSFAAYTAGATSAGNAAEKAQKQMAGFDNLNILASPTTASSGGSGGSSGGTNAADFETVGTVGSDLATKVRGAIDMLRDPLDRLSTAMGPLLGQLQIFWDQYLVPFGIWTIGTGLPALVDVLAKVFTWLNNNPAAVTGIAAFAAACLVLSGISKIAIGVNATVTGLGALGSLLGVGGATAVGLTLSATLALAALTVGSMVVLGALSVSERGKAPVEEKKTVINEASSSTSGYMPQTSAIIIDSLKKGNVLKALGAWGEMFNAFANSAPARQVAAGIASNPDFDPFSGMPTSDAEITIGNSAKFLQDAASAKTAIENLFRPMDMLSGKNTIFGKSFDDLAGKTVDTTKGFKFLQNGVDLSYSKIKTSTSTLLLPTMSAARIAAVTATSGINGAFGGMPASIQAQLAGLNNTVWGGMNAVSGTLAERTASGTGAALGSYSGMPSVVQAHLAALDATVKTGAQNAHTSLAGKTTEGVNAALGSYAGMPSAIEAQMQLLAEAVDRKSVLARDVLWTHTQEGVNNSSGQWSHFSNDGTSKITTFAENVRRAMEAVLRNMGKLPSTAAGARGFSGLTTGFLDQIHNLPMFAQGGYVGANQPQLAIIGDNKTQGEIITPENAMAAAVAKGIAASGGGGDQTIHITLQNVLDGRILSESVTKYQVRKARQTNKPILGY